MSQTLFKLHLNHFVVIFLLNKPSFKILIDIYTKQNDFNQKINIIQIGSNSIELINRPQFELDQ